MTLPPGTILQFMYLEERLRARRPGTFIEIGVGRGQLSGALLKLGWSGIGLELDSQSAEDACKLNAADIARGRYQVINADWMDECADAQGIPDRVDLIISSMVLEHLDERGEAHYFSRCAGHLSRDGLCVLLVPASIDAWGIEDEIAGHYRRYTFSRFMQLLPALGWHIEHMVGLTFPLSNILLPISNYLVSRGESAKRTMELDARTRASGRRDVYGKTVFPTVAGLILNRWVMYPFHLLQKAFLGSGNALVIYLECVPAGQIRPST